MTADPNCINFSIHWVEKLMQFAKNRESKG
jgi:hypothetical protein